MLSLIIMKEKLRQCLALRPKQQISDTTRVPAAVVLPLFYKNGECWILFIKRTETVKYHKGQISFPGGRRETKDLTLRDTALRELYEEIGVPPDNVELLGELDDSVTVTSNYIISTFVGLIPYPYEFKPDPREVAYIIEIPISALLNESCLIEENSVTEAKNIVYYFDYQDKVIWGATARILKQFLETWTQLSKK
jgi:8-oxo-dGTP pyrophosphatase MutT (NUDIX family)